MITKEVLLPLIEAYLKNTDCQLQTLRITPEKNILVEIDSYNGVDIDVCEGLNRHLIEQLGEDAGNYSFEVGSVSLTAPFVSLMQYKKHIGDNVEALTREGKKVKGILVEAEEDHFSLDIEVSVKAEGEKKKHKEIQTRTWKYDEVKYCMYLLKV